MPVIQAKIPTIYSKVPTIIVVIDSLQKDSSIRKDLLRLLLLNKDNVYISISTHMNYIEDYISSNAFLWKTRSDEGFPVYIVSSDLDVQEQIKNLYNKYYIIPPTLEKLNNSKYSECFNGFISQTVSIFHDNSSNNNWCNVCNNHQFNCTSCFHTACWRRLSIDDKIKLANHGKNMLTKGLS